MCDYSLHAFPNRLAEDGEELLVHRFGGASIGLASAADVRCATLPPNPSASFWNRAKDWFWGRVDLDLSIPAVCIPPGARLMLRDIPKSLQRDLEVGEVEEVRFVQTSADENTYRDAIRFRNNQQILLQMLREGQRVRVLSLDLVEEEIPAIIESQPVR